MEQAKKSGRISLKDHQADSRGGGCWGRPGEEPRLSAPTLSWGPPCGRLGAAISPTGEEGPEHWELRTASRWIKCEVRGGEPWAKLACCLWSEQSWAGLSSPQLSMAVFMLLPRSCPVTSLYSSPELPLLLPCKQTRRQQPENSIRTEPALLQESRIDYVGLHLTVLKIKWMCVRVCACVINQGERTHVHPQVKGCLIQSVQISWKKELHNSWNRQTKNVDFSWNSGTCKSKLQWDITSPMSEWLLLTRLEIKCWRG